MIPSHLASTLQKAGGAGGRSEGRAGEQRARVSSAAIPTEPPVLTGAC